jgi:ribosome-binding protein aMBF1 (putative translation factor)
MVRGMSFVDQSISLIRQAVGHVGKKPLARRVRVSDASLRRLDHSDFSPTARTLRKLESAARDVLRERGVPEDIH